MMGGGRPAAGRRQQLLLLAVLLGCCLHLQAGAYQVNDFVPIARRGQFRGMRTHWHDALGRHCPRFGVDRIVALPIPKPTTWQNGSDYKISFSVAQDRYLTGWLPIMGAGMEEPPLVDLTFVYSGDTIHSVEAELFPMPDSFREQNEELIKEYLDESVWPKHILIHYAWEEEVDVDVNVGLVFLIVSGLLFSAIATIISLRSYRKKLAKFALDVIADTTGPAESGKSN